MRHALSRVKYPPCFFFHPCSQINFAHHHSNRIVSFSPQALLYREAGSSIAMDEPASLYSSAWGEKLTILLEWWCAKFICEHG